MSLESSSHCAEICIGLAGQSLAYWDRGLRDYIEMGLAVITLMRVEIHACQEGSRLRDLPREGPAERPRIPAQVTPAHVPAHVPEICFETGRTYIDFQTEFGISGISILEIYIDFDWTISANVATKVQRSANQDWDTIPEI